MGKLYNWLFRKQIKAQKKRDKAMKKFWDKWYEEQANIDRELRK